MKKQLVLTALLASHGLYAAEVVSLADGRTIQLNDDFTWHYVSESSPTSDPSPAVIPVVQAQPAANIVIGDDKPTLQVSDSGIDVLVGSADYQSGQLRFPTSITNQGSQSIVLVEVMATLFDPQGKQLGQETFSVWQSIKRLPDTYLREKTSKTGRDIVFQVSQQPSYLMDVKIINIETR